MGGPSGPRGVLLQCESRAGRQFWRVRLQDATANGGTQWVWPDDLGGVVVEGEGDAVALCQSCGLRFILRHGSGELICSRCDLEQFGTAERVSDPPPAKRFGDTRIRRRWIPSKGRHS
jgi:hypothetical protein